MGKVFIKDVKITGIHIMHDVKYHLLIRLLPNMDDKELSISKTVVKNGIFILQSIDSISFDYTNINDSNIGITLLQTKNENRIIGRVNLPLTWFQINSIVSHDFPIRLKNNTTEISPMISLSIHITDDGSNAFDAPQGKLLITPAWNKPQIQQSNQYIHSYVNQQNPPTIYMYPVNQSISPPFFYQPNVPSPSIVPIVSSNGIQYISAQPQNLIFVTPDSQIIPPLYPYPVFQYPSQQEVKTEDVVKNEIEVKHETKNDPKTAPP